MAKNKPGQYQIETALQKLPASKGGYYFLEIHAALVEQLPQKRNTRLVCVLDKKVTLHCGFNNLGNGHYFIIIAARHIAKIKKKAGDLVSAMLEPTADPLGIEVPEVLSALLEQDEELKQVYDAMTDGKKRSLVFLIKDMKSVDLQVQKATRFLTDVKHNRSPYKRNSK